MLPRSRRGDDLRSAVVLCLLGAALQQLGAFGLLQAKAWLAPQLIERAWQQTLAAGGRPSRPWPWADTWPVARLRAPGQGVDRLVLAGDSGNVLAFGPGHAGASAPLGSRGMAVIGGHRDTHFAFLQELREEDRLRLQLADGGWREYRVTGTRIVDAEREAVTPSPGTERLLLVTCYPFGALRPGGPLRYVVEALPAPTDDAPGSALLL